MITFCNCPDKSPYAIGHVIELFVHATQYDDYFMAIIWDGETAKTQQYESTAYGPCALCGGRATAKVDASPELRASYQAKLAEQARIAYVHDLHYGRAVPRLGDAYTVVRGRKVPKGIGGTCQRVVETQWGHRAALQTSAGIVWVDTKNLQPAA
jgi:hypothetical protein